MPFSQDHYVQALSFAARAHGAQKTPMGLPYVVHLSSVAMEVIAALQAAPGPDADLAITCALLHDIIEDTPTTYAEVASVFGTAVASGVLALSKDATLGKKDAMQDSLRRILLQPQEIAMVKLGDRITNLAPPPPHRTPEKVAAYREEAQMILDALGGSSVFLSERLHQKILIYPGALP